LRSPSELVSYEPRSLVAPSRKRILIAEDDTAFRRLIAASLATDGHDVVEAADGGDMLALLEATLVEAAVELRFNLVISDVRMPGWSGLEVLAGLRHYRVAPPVVLITAFGDERVHAEARRLGAAATLDKPFDLDELRALITTLAS
jgi:DNA-binding response OmpR family regulator